MAPEDLFENEAELCQGFTAAARDAGCKVWSEAGFDLLLQATIDYPMRMPIRRGDFVGIEAKMTGNFKVLSQIRKRLSYDKGPDFYSVLVRKASEDFCTIARELRVMVITPAELNAELSKMLQYNWRTEGCLRYLPAGKPWHPDIEVDIPAGQASPRQQTQWKMKAIELCVRARKKGHLTSRDFFDHNLSMTVWKNRQWIVPTGEKAGRLKIYRLGDNAPDIQNPEIAAAMRDRLDQQDTR